MKLLVKQNATSIKVRVFIQNNSVTTGAGLTGLAFNTASLTAYYYREGDVSTTVITLATATLGTWTSSGFIVVDGTNMPGVYELSLPNACFANIGSVIVYLQGATNMAPVVLEIQVVAFDPTNATLGMSSSLSALRKNTALNNFEFFMALNGAPATGLAVAAQRSIDGGAYAACANAVAEISNGLYTINLAASDLNGTVITLRFSATGANDTVITLIPQPS